MANDNSLLDIANNGAALNQALSELTTNVAKLSDITLPAANGGTGLTSSGASGNVLTSNGTAWISSALPTPAANVSSISFGLTGLTPSTATTGAVSVAGTLGVGNGGTGLSSLTSYGVLCGGTTSTGAIQSLATGTSGQILTSNGSGSLPTFQTKTITSGTFVSSTSGTSINFTGIPSWVKRITVMFNGVRTNGTSLVLLQIGAGSISTSGYVATYGLIVNGGNGISGRTNQGFFVSGNNSSADARYGNITLCLCNGNTWICSGVVSTVSADNAGVTSGGYALGGTLDRVRITTVNGTDQFNAGVINILYE